MINKEKNKIIQVTIPKPTISKLEELAQRFNESKSIIIKNAINVYYSKKNKQFNYYLNKNIDNNQYTKIETKLEENQPSWDELLKEIENN